MVQTRIAFWQPMGQGGNEPQSYLPKMENKKRVMALHCPNIVSPWLELLGKTFPAPHLAASQPGPLQERGHIHAGQAPQGEGLRSGLGTCLPCSMLESEARESEQKLNRERDGGEGAGLSQAVSTVMKWAWRVARRRTVESGSLQWDHALGH